MLHQRCERGGWLTAPLWGFSKIASIAKLNTAAMRYARSSEGASFSVSSAGFAAIAKSGPQSRSRSAPDFERHSQNAA